VRRQRLHLDHTAATEASFGGCLLCPRSLPALYRMKGPPAALCQATTAPSSDPDCAKLHQSQAPDNSTWTAYAIGNSGVPSAPITSPAFSIWPRACSTAGTYVSSGALPFFLMYRSNPRLFGTSIACDARGSPEQRLSDTGCGTHMCPRRWHEYDAVRMRIDACTGLHPANVTCATSEAA